ncbi:hypothetical protein TELCIR_16889 [Teladorsagia circumcincta]|uniref:Peptidase M12A domain-containing protein n=1 Tax=Teladorsagia circumcincta TaxID=45464 RepID=A0A2G9TUC5_TELCI|nr:hypothetical protein TELCIR_16889 [Teladorsagia circumcincta]
MTFIDSGSINKLQPAVATFDLDYQQTIGSPFISFIDLSMINELYGCKRDLSPQPLEDFKVCNYWINSPPGTEIEIIFVSFSNNFGFDGCVAAGVEIKTNKDQRLTGYSSNPSTTINKDEKKITMHTVDTVEPEEIAQS